jgi:hypothetical protein
MLSERVGRDFQIEPLAARRQIGQRQRREDIEARQPRRDDTVARRINRQCAEGARREKNEDPRTGPLACRIGECDRHVRGSAWRACSVADRHHYLLYGWSLSHCDPRRGEEKK